jgi:hypothetical protein
MAHAQNILAAVERIRVTERVTPPPRRTFGGVVKLALFVLLVAISDRPLLSNDQSTSSAGETGSSSIPAPTAAETFLLGKVRQAARRVENAQGKVSDAQRDVEMAQSEVADATGDKDKATKAESN